MVARVVAAHLRHIQESQVGKVCLDSIAAVCLFVCLFFQWMNDPVELCASRGAYSLAAMKIDQKDGFCGRG